MADRVEIAGHRVGRDEPCLVVAEIGINHNGDIGLARKLISARSPPGATR